MKPSSYTDSSQIDPRLDQISDGLYRVSIKAIIIHDHQLLMTHEPDDWYSVPGGGMVHGATIEQTLQRELYEELGIQADTIRIEPNILAANFGSITRGLPRANIYFRVHLTDYTKVVNGELEHLWATKGDLDQLLLSPSTTKIADLLKSLL